MSEKITLLDRITAARIIEFANKKQHQENKDNNYDTYQMWINSRTILLDLLGQYVNQLMGCDEFKVINK